MIFEFIVIINNSLNILQTGYEFLGNSAQTEANLLNNLVLAIISVSATIAGISAAFVPSLWNRLKKSMRSLETPHPLDAEVARREMHTVRFIIIPHIISIALLSLNAIFGLILFVCKFVSSHTILLLLIFFCTGLYSLFIPFLIALRDDFRLIRLHEKFDRKESKINEL